MPLPKKPSPPAVGPAAPRPTRYPRRIVGLVILRDESGSMKWYPQRVGEFLPAVLKSLLEAGGPKVADLVYVLYVVVSGGVATAGFAPLSRIADPEFAPDGQTPMGQGLGVVVDTAEAFLTDVFAAETTVKKFEILLVSDLKSTGETTDQTEAGVEKFIAFAKRYKAGVTVVGPSPEDTNGEMAARLDVNGKGLTYLDSDPGAVLKVAFDSVLSASRALTGSNPRIRNG